MYIGRPALLVSFFLLLNAVFVSAQEPEQSYRIDNSDADTVFYCRTPVAVAPGITIENIDIENSSDGIKISIANYRKGEDVLHYSGVKFSQKWENDYGNLELTGIGTAEEYEEAVRQVFYENVADNPSTEPRSFSITLLDADFLPHTGHFYRYIRKRGIPWTEARDSAASMNYYGLQGYLATITSSIENDFIWTKIDGVGWIGANDAADEGVWRWVTGPEAGTHFWQGTYQNGYAVQGRYSNWNTGEPNNVQKEWGDDEDYAHINADPGTVPKSWNDLPNEGDKNSPNGYYYPEGFVVEFGGMDDDPEVQLSASAVIDWSQKPEMELVDFSPLMCGENRQQLHLRFNEEVTTKILSLHSGSIVEDELSADPVVVLPPGDFGEYRFEVEITNRHQCDYTEEFSVKYQHKPTAQFQIDEAECEGYNLKLFFEGEREGDARFDWYSSDTLFYSGMNTESLEIPLGYGMVNRSVGLKIDEDGCSDSLRLPVTVTPVFDFWAENPEGCTPLNVQFDYSATETIDDFFWEFGDGSSSTDEKPTHVFQNTQTEDKIFDVSLKIVSAEGCENSGTLKDLITVHPIPSLDFDFDEAVCYSEIAEVNYKGSADSSDTFFWDLSDFDDDEITENPQQTSGPLQFALSSRPSVKIGIQVISEFGCETDTLRKTFSRKPLFHVSPDTIGGCPPLNAEFRLTTTDSLDDVSYVWDLGQGSLAEGVWVEKTYTESNRHTDISVTAVSAVTGCADTLFLPGKVYAYPVPQAAFNPSPPAVIISDPVIYFENLSEGATLFDWDFGDGAFSSLETPSHRFEEMGRYDVTLWATNEFGCLDSTSSQVAVAFDRVFPPNAFSPNSPKEEDRVFRIYSEGISENGYKLLIFNRWGEIIFESENQEMGWNGKMKNGRNAPAGVYTWVLEYSDFLGNKNKQQGTVTLLY
jgi:gliding motility-associated-like protein